MKIHFYSGIRDISGCKELELPYEKNAGLLLNTLCEHFGGKFKEKIYSEAGKDGEVKFNKDTLILINGRHIMQLGGANALIKQDDRIDILPVVGGG